MSKVTGSFENRRKQLEQNMRNRLVKANRYASLTKRAGAFIVDYLLGSIFVSILPMIITSIITREKAFTIAAFTSMPIVWQAAASIIAMLAAVYYYCIYPMNKNHLGQTPGKRLMKIRVIRAGGKELTYQNMLLRELIGSFLLEGETAFPSAFGRYFLYQLMPGSIAGFLSAVSLAMSAGSVIWAICNERHMMIHDYIGKTMVVKAGTEAADS